MDLYDIEILRVGVWIEVRQHVQNMKKSCASLVMTRKIN